MLAAAAAAGGALAQAPQLDDERPRLPGRRGAGQSAALADVDADGRLDLVRATAAGLEVLVQQQSGAYLLRQGPLALPSVSGGAVVAVRVLAAAAASPPDLVVGLANDDSLWLVNDGSGAFAVRLGAFPRPSGFTGATTQVLTGDVDGDGRDDVVVLHDGATPQTFARQAGSFKLLAGSLPSQFLPQSPIACLEDLDGDFDRDLVVLQRGATSRPVLLLNDSAGAFAVVAATTAFPTWTPYAATQVRAAELTGDTLPDLVLAPAAGGLMRILANSASTAFREVPMARFPVAAVADFAVGDADGDRRGDLLVLEQSGTTLLALQANGLYSAARSLLGGPARVEITLGDLEPDGDLDLFALGLETEDRLLLGSGRGTFFDTEEVTVPLGSLSALAELELLDVTGEGDPDIIGWADNGAPIELINDGAARFHSGPGRVPALPVARAHELEPLAVQVGGSDLAVLATTAGGQRDVRILVSTGAGLADETATRWGGLGSGAAAMAAGRITGAALDDLVVIDETGRLWLFGNANGRFVAQLGAFAPGLLTGAVKLLLGNVDGDPHLDLVVLRTSGPPAVFLGSRTAQFSAVPLPVVGSFPARDGVLTDVDGDGVTDLLILSPPPTPTLFLLKGIGGGTFVDQSASAPGPLPGEASAIALLHGPGTASPLLLGSATSHDVILPRLAGGFGPPIQLPARGSLSTTEFLVGDLDVDGDRDVVIARSGHLPAVLLNQRLQLTQTGVAQVGRPLVLRVRAPASGIVALLLGPQTRLALPPYGWLRIHPAGMVVLPQFGVSANAPTDWSLPTPPTLPEISVPVQGAFVNIALLTAELSNLELARLVRY